MDTRVDLEKGQPLSSMRQSSGSKSSAPSAPSTGSVDKSIARGLPKSNREPLQAQNRTRLSQFLRDYYTTYRQIFTVVFTVNLSVLIALVVAAQGSPSITAVSNAAAVNLAVGVLFRQEQVVNSLFYILTSVPRCWPLLLRIQVAKVFHYGGFHSGCGVAAVVWFLVYTALATRAYLESSSPSPTTTEGVITAWILVALFTLMLGSAYPAFRVRYHNYFEAFHRFAGWATLAIFWAHVFFSAHSNAADDESSMALALARSVPFWCILTATIPVIASWTQLRRRSVRVDPLSDHATRLCFDYTQLPPCYGIRVSTNPLLEWHSFATIPDTLESTISTPSLESVACQPSSPATSVPTGGFSIVVSNAGDWTSRTIRSPPRKLWVRGSPLRGVIFSARLFHRVVIVATGSGIGPCLSLLVAHSTLLPTNPRVIWSAPSPALTFGERIVGQVKVADPEAVIWDTMANGRPDLCSLAEEVTRECEAEAVFIISNPKVCKMMVCRLGDRGIPAFVPIFDS